MKKANTNSDEVSPEPINQGWHRVVGQMIQKLTDGVQSLPARRTTSYNDATTALGN
jgi:hypothetical protein